MRTSNTEELAPEAALPVEPGLSIALRFFNERPLIDRTVNFASLIGLREPRIVVARSNTVVTFSL